MDKIVIKRDRMKPSAKATFGEIYVNGEKMGVTLEPPVEHIPSGT